MESSSCSVQIAVPHMRSLERQTVMLLASDLVTLEATKKLLHIPSQSRAVPYFDILG